MCRVGYRGKCDKKRGGEKTGRAKQTESGRKTGRGEKTEKGGKKGEEKTQFIVHYNTYMPASIFDIRLVHPLLSKLVQSTYSIHQFSSS